MPIANYSTEQAVEKTMGEVIAALRRRGVVRISTIYDTDDTAAGLEFSMRTEYGVRHFALPVRTEGVLKALSADPKVTPARRTPEHAARVAWAIARDWLRAQSGLIDAGLATLDEVMFPWMLGGSTDQTAFETFRSQQKAIEG
jgi:hypothetical protein